MCRLLAIHASHEVGVGGGVSGVTFAIVLVLVVKELNLFNEL